MITIERLPIACTCATTRLKRRSASGEKRSRSAKKYAEWPSEPSQRMVRAPSAARKSLMRAPSRRDIQIFGQRASRIVEAHRAVGLAADELAHLGIVRRAQFVGRAVRDDLAAGGHQIGIVDGR